MFTSLGWNCYPGWLIRKIVGQSSLPWDWIQIFDSKTPTLLLNKASISDIVDDLIIRNMIPGAVVEQGKPQFWSPKFSIRSPHDHENVAFESLGNSRFLIREKLLRRLERFYALSSGRRVIFLTSFNNGEYGIPGYVQDTYLDSLIDFHRESVKRTKALSVNIVICGQSHTSWLQNESKPFLEGAMSVIAPSVYFMPTRFSFEDAFYPHTSANISTDEALEFWVQTINSIPRLLSAYG